MGHSGHDPNPDHGTPRAPVVRPARPGDLATVLTLIRELADYERALPEVKVTEQALFEALFCDRPAAYCHVVDYDGEVAGFALWFLNFSTWLGVHGIHLEDLYVRPSFRGRGLGKALLRALAQICVARGYGRLEWWVLDWNEPALGFYHSIDAQAMDDWTVHRVTGEALARLAGPVAGPVAGLQSRPGARMSDRSDSDDGPGTDITRMPPDEATTGLRSRGSVERSCQQRPLGPASQRARHQAVSCE